VKVAEYHRQGLHHRVESPPPDYTPLGQEVRESGHRVAFFARVENEHLADVVYTSSKRCRKLMALADVAAERLKGQPASGYHLDPDALVDFFREERDRAKMHARVQLIMNALGLSKPLTGRVD